VTNEPLGQSFRSILVDAESIPGNAFALHKYGIEPKSLDILSVNPTGTIKQSVRSVCSAFWASKQCAAPLQLITSFVSAWHWQRDFPITVPIILASFISLSGMISPFIADSITMDMQRFYSEASWSEQSLKSYVGLTRGLILPLIHDFFNQGRAAMENFILLLSMLFNLRYKVQDALLRALYRSQAWIRRRIDMLGVSSLQAQNFIMFSFVQLASDFHTAVAQAPAISRSSTSAWLAIVESIPQTHTHSLRELHFNQAFDKFVKTLSDHTVFHDDYLRTDQPAAAPTPAAVTPSGKPRRPRNKGKGSPATVPAVTPAPNNPSSTNVVTPATPNPSSSRQICVHFVSSMGCKYRNGACRFLHSIPPAGSADRMLLNDLLKAKRLSPSQSYLRGNSE
jgi:hypothetical protein